MLFGKRRPRMVDARRRDHDTFRPRGEALEPKVLLAIDLGGTSPPTNPFIATIPYGMDFGSAQTGQLAGTSVSDVGDLLNNGFEDFAIGAPGNSGPEPGGAVYVILGSQTLNSTGGLVLSNWIQTTNGAFT